MITKCRENQPSQRVLPQALCFLQERGVSTGTGKIKHMHLLGILLKEGRHRDSGGQGDEKSPSIEVFITGQKLNFFEVKQEFLPISFLFLPGFPNLILGSGFTFNSFMEST